MISRVEVEKWRICDCVAGGLGGTPRYYTSTLLHG